MLGLIVELFICLLKVAPTLPFTETPFCPSIEYVPTIVAVFLFLPFLLRPKVVYRNGTPISLSEDACILIGNESSGSRVP